MADSKDIARTAGLLPPESLLQHPAGTLALKRAFDVMVAALALLTVYPLAWLVCAPLIKCSSKGPVLFRQRRTGLGGAEFTCLKFRTMHLNDEADTRQSSGVDERVFPSGLFLRRTGLDELPQLLNILLGEMSLVGPRPHMLSHTDYYGARIEGYALRHRMRPGITGWAQVSGSRGETPELSDMQRRVTLDNEYIDRWSLGLDAKILFKTLLTLLHL